MQLHIKFMTKKLPGTRLIKIHHEILHGQIAGIEWKKPKRTGEQKRKTPCSDVHRCKAGEIMQLLLQTLRDAPFDIRGRARAFCEKERKEKNCCTNQGNKNNLSCPTLEEEKNVMAHP